MLQGSLLPKQTDFKMRLPQEEYDSTYSALKLIECLYNRNQISAHLYNCILHEYRGKIDLSDFKRPTSL